MASEKYVPEGPCYAVVCYPDIPERHRELIEAYRKDHDVFARLIPAHFTLVFPTTGYFEEAFIEEVSRRCRDFRSFDFVARCAIMNNDLTSDLWHVLLVPDEGFSQVVLLHERLCSGALAPTQRLDLDFIPHIAVGNSTDPERCRELVVGINARNLKVSGRVSTLDVVLLDQGQCRSVHRIDLRP